MWIAYMYTPHRGNRQVQKHAHPKEALRVYSPGKEFTWMVEDDVFQGDGREGELLLPQDHLTKPHEWQDHGHLHALAAHHLPHTLTPVSAFPFSTVKLAGHLLSKGARFPCKSFRASLLPHRAYFDIMIDIIMSTYKRCA